MRRPKKPPLSANFSRRAPRNRGKPAPAANRVFLFGLHPAEAALLNPRRTVLRVLATENAARRLEAPLRQRGLAPELVIPRQLDRLVGPEAVHQGIVIEAAPLSPIGIDDVEAEGFLVVLDQVTDPHNVGAVFRSAAAFAASAVVTTARHSPETTGVLAKAASGALEHVPLITVQNLARALAALKARDFFVVGLDATGQADLDAMALRTPLALVLGAEGKGLRQLTKDTCDHVARLALPGAIKSLNVSNAAAIALHIAADKLG
jgi:23S rRNA (guanosine2251-2'-O)-methyltransferase